MEPWSAARFVSAMIVWAVITFTYYSFHHYVHHRRFHFNNNAATHAEHAQRLLAEAQVSSGGHEQQRGHGQRFDDFHGKDDVFFYGFALPLTLLTVAGLVWNKSRGGGRKSGSRANSTNSKTLSDLQLSETSSDTSSSDHGSSSDSGSVANDTTLPSGLIAKAKNCVAPTNNGDINVAKWTIIWFLVPMVLIIFDGMRSRSILHASADQQRRGWGLYKRICMSLLSPSGYAATWPLALFLIPVTKHSPILDWLRVTPVQALAFHRICGWVSFWWSWAHGFLHLQHLMEVLNRDHARTPLQQFKYLLVPDEMRNCFLTQNPWLVFWGEQTHYPGTEQESRQCWLALVNGTGMVRVAVLLQTVFNGVRSSQSTPARCPECKVSCIAFAILAVTSVTSFRRNFYTLFYLIHIPMAWIMLVAAIWHYPMCVLLLLPNIIYYLSFNIPVGATQAVEQWAQWCDNKKDKTHADQQEDKASALVQAKLIQGGSVELTFAVAPGGMRHESCYVRVFCPGASVVSHPFSIFSRDDLQTIRHEGSASLATRSILLRSKGPFTEAMKKMLFPHHAAGGGMEGMVAAGPTSQAPPSSHDNIQFDSFYAGSVDWVEKAMESHDEILILAGGVGIVPFLEFLPALQQQIETGQGGPKSIHLHWYCREIGLASHIVNGYLKPHVQKVWDSNPMCHGRLKCHVHLTKSPKGEDTLASVSNSGLVETRSYMNEDGENQQSVVSPVQDARFAQSLGMRLLLPGFLTVGGILGHWWWYTQFVRAELFRRNLLIRSHSVVFSLLLAVTVSVAVEVYVRQRSKNGYSLVVGADGTNAGHKKENQGSAMDATAIETEVGTSTETSMVSLKSTYAYASTVNTAVPSDFLKVTGGRPPMDAVIQDVLQAKQPGVYSCGPRALLDAVEEAIRRKRDDCAFYQENSEM